MKQIIWVFLLLAGCLLWSCLGTDSSSASQSAQFTKDTTAIINYLNQNNIKATRLPSSIWFIIDSAADGIRPTFNDTIFLKYSLNLIPSNSVLGNSTTPVSIILSSQVAGLQVALPQFQKGSKGRIFMPSSFGFGSAGTTGVAPNSNLVYEFKLSDVKAHQLTLDTTAIAAYLSAHAIKAFKDVSGLRYTIETLGTGTSPSLLDDVQVTYTAKILSNESIVDQGNAVAFQLSGLILGWQIGLPIIQEGSTVTLYVPSSLAYGPNGSGNTIRANENMIFNIQLLKVNHH